MTDTPPATINPWRLFHACHVPNWLARMTDVSPGAKLAYGRLCQFAGRDGIARPHLEELGEELGCTERNAGRYTKELEEAGLIRKERVGLNLPNKYHFLWHPEMGLPDPTDTSDPEWTDASGPDTTDSSGQDQTDPAEQGGPIRPVPPLLEESVSESEEPPGRDEPGHRPEVDELCDLLAKLVVENGSKPPTITKAWRTAARLLIDKDGRSATQVEAVIRWCQRDEFWRANVLSMPTLRRQFDKLRLQRNRDIEARRGGSSSSPAGADALAEYAHERLVEGAR